MGPIEQRDAKHRYGQHPNKYVEIFKNINITRVIRLNEEKYNKDHFVNNGIDHTELFFVDGSTPPDHIVKDFFKVVEAHFD